jgi:hypothetical protein
MRRFLWTILIVTALALAACGGDDDDNDTNDAGNTVDDTSSVPEQTGDRNYSVTVTGDFESTIPPGLAQAWEYADPARFELFFGDMDRNVQITINGDVSATTYDLTVEDFFNADQAAFASVGKVVDPDDIMAGVQDFNEEISGAITITAIDEDQVSGNFEFTAVYADTDDSGAEIRQEVSVTGEFDEMMILRDEE